MFLVLQHPFADLRGFVGAESGRLAHPSWPLAEPERDHHVNGNPRNNDSANDAPVRIDSCTVK